MIDHIMYEEGRVRFCQQQHNIGTLGHPSQTSVIALQKLFGNYIPSASLLKSQELSHFAIVRPREWAAVVL